MTFFGKIERKRYRTETVSPKSIETLEWIDRYGDGVAFFETEPEGDLYGIHSAKMHVGTACTFESSVVNLGLTPKNISINDLADYLAGVAKPLAMSKLFDPLRIGYDGQALASEIARVTKGMISNWMVDHGFVANPPTMMTIDIDGIEHLALRDWGRVPAMTNSATVLIEVNEDSGEMAPELTNVLGVVGLLLAKRHHSDMIDFDHFAPTFNQIRVTAR